jgi:hypothetical protein
MDGTGMRDEPGSAAQQEYVRADSLRVREIGQRFVRGSGRTTGLSANVGTQPVVHGVHWRCTFYTVGGHRPHGAE